MSDFVKRLRTQYKNENTTAVAQMRSIINHCFKDSETFKANDLVHTMLDAVCEEEFERGKAMSNGIHSGNPYNASDWIVAPNCWAMITDKGPQFEKLLCPNCVVQWYEKNFSADHDDERNGPYQCSGNVDDIGPTPEAGDNCVVCKQKT